MSSSQNPDLLATVKAALRKPPKIVAAFLDAGVVSAVSGSGGVVSVGGAPAGGTDRGWWSNGCYLMYKSETVACRPFGTRNLQVLEAFAGLVQGSGLVKGLETVSVPNLV